MGVSRELNYDVQWPVPEFVGLSVTQALALADETGIVLSLPAGSSGRVVRQEAHGSGSRRPTRVTVWLG